MARARIGLKCKAYLGESELSIVRDTVNLTLNKNEADVSRRGNDWDLARGTSKVLSADFQVLDIEDDADVATLMDSFLNGTPIEMYFLNGPKDTAGSEGPHAEFEVMQMNRNEARKDAVVYDVVVKPTDGPTSGLPEWFVAPAA